MNALPRTETGLIIAGTLLVLIFGLISSALIARSQSSLEYPAVFSGSWACTADAFVCPDGSVVGRVPPYCHFEKCPK